MTQLSNRTDVWVWFVFSSNPTSRYFLRVAFHKCRTVIFNIFSPKILIFFYFHSNTFCFREHAVILVSAALLSWFVTFNYVATALLLKSRFLWLYQNAQCSTNTTENIWKGNMWDEDKCVQKIKRLKLMLKKINILLITCNDKQHIGIALLYFFLQLQGKQALLDFRAT